MPISMADFEFFEYFQAIFCWPVVTFDYATRQLMALIRNESVVSELIIESNVEKSCNFDRLYNIVIYY